MPLVTPDFTEGRELRGPVAWPAFFGLAPEDAAGRAVEIEVGCGNGRYLRRAAAERPGHLFVGIERSLSYARKARDRMLKYAVGNARIVRDDATRFLQEHAPENSVDGLHVYFTDPWPKAKHARRRLFQPSFFETMRRILRPGAPVFVKVDLYWYFEEILCRFEASAGFDVEANGVDTERERDLYEVTGFEQKALEKKGAVYCLRARRREVDKDIALPARAGA